MSRKALVLLVCCCDFRDVAERPPLCRNPRNGRFYAVFRGFLHPAGVCRARRAAVVQPRERKKSADRRRRILISRLLIIRASVPRRKSPFPAYFKGFPAVSPLIPPYPAFLKYPVSPHGQSQSAYVRRFLYHGFKFISTAQYSSDIATLWCIGRQLAPDLTDDIGNGGAAAFTVSIPYGLINLAG